MQNIFFKIMNELTKLRKKKPVQQIAAYMQNVGSLRKFIGILFVSFTSTIFSFYCEST